MAKDIRTEIKGHNIEVLKGHAILIIHTKHQEADSIIANEALTSLRETVKMAKPHLVHYASVEVLPKDAMPKLLSKIKSDKADGKAVVVSATKFLESLKHTDAFDTIYFSRDVYDPMKKSK